VPSLLVREKESLKTLVSIALLSGAWRRGKNREWEWKAVRGASAEREKRESKNEEGTEKRKDARTKEA